VLEATEDEVAAVFDGLIEEYARGDRGVRILRLAGGYQMVTRPDLAEGVARFLAGPAGKSRLSRAALETVAIVAYKQPATQADVEAVRGVNCDGVLKTLLDRKLIKEKGRKNVPGRPFLYGTTDGFLHYFGLNALDDLPPLEEAAKEEAEEAERVIHVIEEAVGLVEE
jgi:segregation and condensation protein B